MRVLEIAGFVTLSGALHVAALTIAPFQGGGSGGGEGGAADVSLQAATPTLAAMVADWDRPPEVGAAPDLTAPTAEAAPDRPLADSAGPALVTAALPVPTSGDALPQADTRLPAPATPFAQPAPEALPVPDMPRLAALPVPALSDRPVLVRPSVQPLANADSALPRIDTEPPSGQFAPQVSPRPEPRPERRTTQDRTKPSLAQPSTKARGSGQHATAAAAPPARSPVAPGPSKARLAQLEQQWGAQITSALRRAHRPPNGRATGTVKLVLTITPAGQVAGVSMVSSSGDSRLDQSALTAVKRARFPRAPEGLTKASYRFSQRLTVAR